MKRILVFDVNETLLDLEALDPHFKRVFGNTATRQQWFSQFIQSALVSIVTNAYTPFGLIGKAALEMTAEKKGVSLSEEDKKEILTGITKLPPHPEVPQSLAKLKENGFTIIALTNSTQEIVEKQLQNAGIIQYFDKVFSADKIKRLKPAKEPYEMVAKECNTQIQNIRLIAAHAWDIAGALRVGCAAAFIARPGMVLDPLVELPDVVGKNLQEVADKIIDIEKD